MSVQSKSSKVEASILKVHLVDDLFVKDMVVVFPASAVNTRPQVPAALKLTNYSPFDIRHEGSHGSLASDGLGSIDSPQVDPPMRDIPQP